MRSTALGQSVAKSKTGELWWVSECSGHHDGSFVRSVSAQINLGKRHQVSVCSGHHRVSLTWSVRVQVMLGQRHQVSVCSGHHRVSLTWSVRVQVILDQIHQVCECSDHRCVSFIRPLSECPVLLLLLIIIMGWKRFTICSKTMRTKHLNPLTAQQKMATIKQQQQQKTGQWGHRKYGILKLQRVCQTGQNSLKFSSAR